MRPQRSTPVEMAPKLESGGSRCLVRFLTDFAGLIFRVMCLASLACPFVGAQQQPGAQPVLPGTQQLPSPAIAGAVTGGFPPTAQDATGYVLGPGDQIVIHATNAPEIDGKTVRVDLRGEINMPTMGHIHAAGLTPSRLEAEMVKRLKVYLEEPDVAVDVMDFKSQPISVIGEVGSPGVRQVEAGKTLLEILSACRGRSNWNGRTQHQINQAYRKRADPARGGADRCVSDVYHGRYSVKAAVGARALRKRISLFSPMTRSRFLKPK